MHEGHRQRMYEKLEDGADLFDHEVLEILLYGVCPRVNTNPIAHALLDRFISLSEVLNASVDELKEVDGVGETVARYIRSVGLCAERAGNIGNSPTLKTFGDCKRFVELRLKNKSEEHLELYFLNKACRVQRIFTYTTSESSRALVKIDEIARNIFLSRPYSLIIAHNHVKAEARPSDYDDRFTNVVQMICNMNGVQLTDHLIYSDGNGFYSYKDSGKLDKTKNSCSWEKFEKWIKTLN